MLLMYYCRNCRIKRYVESDLPIYEKEYCSEKCWEEYYRSYGAGSKKQAWNIIDFKLPLENLQTRIRKLI